ncbi:MAG TPA: 5-formyltetrahydrofolate cyclo-ligase [Planctomycetota bacterium]|nr:5-formyltetrahydrofolate cyclo-ligase [Planctomycetota bacterium]
MAGSLEKSRLRSEILALLRSMGAAERSRRSALAVTRLAESRLFREAKTVFTYSSTSEELDTLGLCRLCFEQNKTVCLPRTLHPARSMAAHAVTNLDSDLEVHPFGFLQPKAELPVQTPETIDLIVVPGVAFDAAGNRLGRGAGYYDRYLSQPQIKAAVIALAFEVQIVPVVPVQAHDRRVQKIFTEQRVIEVS